jgi:hypothetical protein
VSLCTLHITPKRLHAKRPNYLLLTNFQISLHFICQLLTATLLISLTKKTKVLTGVALENLRVVITGHGW